MSDHEKDEHYKRYGWKVNEDNLATLPASAPEAAKALSQWLTLEGRRSSLSEWIGQVQDDGRIHGKFWHIGAWTQRMSHSSPNQANIPAISDVAPRTPVEHIKAKYDHQLRALFNSGNAWLVGCDADGIQLRVLAHYMRSKDYRDAILSGDKALGTDIHSLNQRALGTGLCRSRDDAKTFIYAWLLGAGVDKVASILGCNRSQAQAAINNFLHSLPELKRLKDVDIKAAAAKGGFTGLDGRFVSCDSEHLMLAGMLQAGEAVIMKLANTIWYHNLKATGIRWEQVDFVHDEWQTIVYGTREDAERVGAMQAHALELAGIRLSTFCPISGTYRVGRNWKETH